MKRILLAVMLFCTSLAQAQTWPSQSIKFIVPVGVGNGPDLQIRMIADLLKQQLGQPVIVENKPGIAGAAALREFVKSPNDHTFLHAFHGAIIVSEYVVKNPGYDIDKDLTPVIHVIGVPHMIMVKADSKLNTLDDLIKYAKSKPGPVFISTTARYVAGHTSAEMLAIMTGANFVSVPHNNLGQAQITFLADSAEIHIDTWQTSLPLIQSGKAKYLAVTTSKRLDALKSLPTVAETLKGFDVSPWTAIFAHSSTPKAIVDRLNQAVNIAMKDPKFQETFLKYSQTDVGGSPERLQAIVKRDQAEFKKLAARLNIQPE